MWMGSSVGCKHVCSTLAEGDSPASLMANVSWADEELQTLEMGRPVRDAMSPVRHRRWAAAGGHTTLKAASWGQFSSPSALHYLFNYTSDDVKLYIHDYYIETEICFRQPAEHVTSPLQDLASYIK